MTNYIKNNWFWLSVWWIGVNTIEIPLVPVICMTIAGALVQVFVIDELSYKPMSNRQRYGLNKLADQLVSPLRYKDEMNPNYWTTDEVNDYDSYVLIHQKFRYPLRGKL